MLGSICLYRIWTYVFKLLAILDNSNSVHFMQKRIFSFLAQTLFNWWNMSLVTVLVPHQSVINHETTNFSLSVWNCLSAWHVSQACFFVSSWKGWARKYSKEMCLYQIQEQRLKKNNLIMKFIFLIVWFTCWPHPHMKWILDADVDHDMTVMASHHSSNSSR